MRWFLSFLLSCTIGTLLQAQPDPPQYVPGELIVMVKDGAAISRVVEDLASLDGADTGLVLVEELSSPLRTWLLRFDPEAVPQLQLLRAVQLHPAVQLAQNNHLLEERAVPDDPEYGSQWHHQTIGSEAAWDISTGGVTATGDTIVVCIMERADLPHPDLIDNAWYNWNEIPGNGLDDDGNGYVDDFRGWSPPTGTDVVYGTAHGTQVAGMAGARGNNGLGVSGANWQVKLMPVHYGSATEAQAVAAYTYPLVMRQQYNSSNGALGAFVVATSSSWGVNNGQPANSPIWCAVYDSLGAAGVLSCGATANSNVDVDVVGDLPTACPSDFLIAVTSTNQSDEKVNNAAFGANSIDLGAPGQGVVTTTLGGGYTAASGTSFASPLVAGVIGLLYGAPCSSLMQLVQADPSAGAQYVRQTLITGVDPLPTLEGITVTGGRVSAGNSMQLIMDGCGTCPAPYGLQAINTGLTTTTLQWASINGDVFDLRYRAVGAADWTEVNGLTDTQWPLADLLSCTPYEFQVRVGCDDEASGYSSVRTWTSEGCCTIPTALMVTATEETSALVEWIPVLAANDHDLRWRRTIDTEWVTANGVGMSPFQVDDLQPCTIYLLQARSSCDGTGSEWSPSSSFYTPGCGACMDLVFCPSQGANALSEWIARVTVGTIDNASASNGGYGDFTPLSTDLVIGAAHPITLVPGFIASSFGEYFRVWIDLDRNGAFTTPDELVYDPLGTTTGPITGELVIPAEAQPGPTRMRVVMKYQTAANDGCQDNYSYGETEDYCAMLMTGSGLNGPGNPANDLQLFPSPADDLLYVRMAGPAVGAVQTLSIVDRAGRIVHTQRVSTELTTIRVEHLAAGVYQAVLMRGGHIADRARFAVVHMH